jgi:hypothetical protein
MKLYYNCSHPIEILESLTIKISRVTRDRGVSMSSVPINCHGPFTFIFKEDRLWYRQFQEVKYELNADGHIDFLHKGTRDFEDEHEWWSKSEVKFALDDVQRIIFRSKSAGAKVQPRIAVRNAREVQKRFPSLFLESKR